MSHRDQFVSFPCLQTSICKIIMKKDGDFFLKNCHFRKIISPETSHISVIRNNEAEQIESSATA